MDHRASASVLHSCLFSFLFFFNYLYVLSVIDLNSSVIELKQFSYIHGAFLHLVLLQLDKECLSDQKWSVVRSPCSLNVYRVAFLHRSVQLIVCEGLGILCYGVDVKSSFPPSWHNTHRKQPESDLCLATLFQTAVMVPLLFRVDVNCGFFFNFH